MSRSRNQHQLQTGAQNIRQHEGQVQVRGGGRDNLVKALARMPAYSVAQSLFALAHRELLGPACQLDRIQRVLAFCLDAKT